MSATTSLAGLFAGGARPRCYIASPLGFSEATRGYYVNEYLPALATFIDPVDPWALSSKVEVDAARERGELRAMWLKIAERNTHAIQESSMLIAHLDGQELDSGTAAEVGYAASRGMPCLAVRSDIRVSGEDEMACNLQVEGFIVQSGGRVFRHLGELTTELRRLSR